MAEALHQVGDVLVYGTLVLHGPAHPLGHLDGARCAKVAVVGAFPHGVDGSHASVGLQPHAVLGVEVVAGGLLGACKQASAHCCAGAHAERLHNVARAPNASVRQDRHTVRTRQLCYVVDSRGLRPAACADLLRCADGADAHAHSESVHAAVNEVLGLALGDDVAADDLQIRVLLLHPTDDVVLERAVSLAAVHHYGVHTCGDQCPDSVPIARPGAHCCSHHEAALFVLRSQGVVCLLAQVRACNQRHELPGLGYDRELAFLGLADDLVGLRELHTLLRRDQVLEWRHHLAHVHGAAVGHKVGVALRHEAQEPGAHLAVLRHREAGEAALRAQLVQLGEQHRGLDADRVHDEAAPVLLHPHDLLHLGLHGEVRVQHAQAPLQRHGGGHARLCDGVHGAGHYGGPQLDLARHVRVQTDVVHAEGDATWEADEVIVGVPRPICRTLKEVLGTVAVQQIKVLQHLVFLEFRVRLGAGPQMPWRAAAIPRAQSLLHGGVVGHRHRHAGDAALADHGCGGRAGALGGRGLEGAPA
mmetsp:Transcript_79933/g.193697  ORF Transcript_79933/g.193697 Transcript_79933/m.193697 type:complete len:530 (-) Transcript_79933:2-1591(-)